MNSQIRVATPILKCPVKILQRLINCTANYRFGVKNVGKSTNQQGTDIRTIFADIFIKNIQLNNNLYPPSEH